MSEMNPGHIYLQSSQSIAFKFFSESVKEIEKQINSTAHVNVFTTEQMDFIVLICDQFRKLVQLRHKSKLIDNLLSYNFPEFFNVTDQNPWTCESASDSAAQPADQQKENEFTFLCDVCDEEVPILNNDPNLSTQLHLNSPYHLEVVSVLRKIKESEASRSSNDCSSINSMTNRPVSNGFQTSTNLGSYQGKIMPNGNSTPTLVFPRSKTNQQSKLPLVSASSPISKAEESFQRFAWIKDKHQSSFLLWRHSMYYCCLCDANLPTQHNFDAHVNSFTHKTKVAAERRTAATNVVGLTSRINISNSVVNASSSPAGNVLSSTFGNTPSRTVVYKRSNAVKNPTTNISTTDFIVSRDGMQYCNLCNVKLPGKSQLESHTNGSVHKEQLKTVAKKPSLALSFDNFIITKSGKRYCSLCNVQLPGESQLNAHKNGSGHKLKLKEYEQKHPSK